MSTLVLIAAGVCYVMATWRRTTPTMDDAIFLMLGAIFYALREKQK